MVIDNSELTLLNIIESMFEAKLKNNFTKLGKMLSKNHENDFLCTGSTNNRKLNHKGQGNMNTLKGVVPASICTYPMFIGDIQTLVLNKYNDFQIRLVKIDMY